MALRSYALFTLLYLHLAKGGYAEAAGTKDECEGRSAPASLLQRDFRNDKKTMDSESDPICSGVSAQGRCWYLSDLGETCTATCSKYGQKFSYVAADTENPLIPKLVGHKPRLKQDPWAPLECYVPEEDRYHTASEAAATLPEKIEDFEATFSKDNCKLACPCSGTASDETANDDSVCTWRQPPACASEYVYEGVTYTGCATVDALHEKPWCQHHLQHSETTPGEPQDWSYCEYSCGPEPKPLPAVPGCVWLPAESCVAEFDYEGKHYIGCSGADHDIPWCSNTKVYEGSWNSCIHSCPGSTPPPSTDGDNCIWQPDQECSPTFQYKGVQYTGCTDVDHPTPWCSHDSNHKGSWTACTKVCSQPTPAPTTWAPTPAPILAPTTVPTLAPTPAPTPAPEEPEVITLAPIPEDPEDPCTRHPEAENDVIGASAPLDETGYKYTAEAESPVNMKRFICRTINKIKCKVVDGPALMGFVPFYSGLVSNQSYQHLEAELTTLCHAGGKWVVPIS